MTDVNFQCIKEFLQRRTLQPHKHDAHINNRRVLEAKVSYQNHSYRVPKPIMLNRMQHIQIPNVTAHPLFFTPKVTKRIANAREGNIKLCMLSLYHLKFLVSDTNRVFQKFTD